MEQLSRTELYPKVVESLDILETDPFQAPPPFKRLSGNMSHLYSRRLNRNDRIVYEIREPLDGDTRKIVFVRRLRSHYEGIVPLFF